MTLTQPLKLENFEAISHAYFGVCVAVSTIVHQVCANKIVKKL